LYSAAYKLNVIGEFRDIFYNRGDPVNYVLKFKALARECNELGARHLKEYIRTVFLKSTKNKAF